MAESPAHEPLALLIQQQKLSARHERIDLIETYPDVEQRIAHARSLIQQLAMHRVFDQFSRQEEASLFDRLWPIAYPEGEQRPPAFGEGAVSKYEPDDSSQPLEIDVIPDSISSQLDLLLAGLRTDAANLAAAEEEGEEQTYTWWEQRFESIQAATNTLEHLEDEALGRGYDLTEAITQLGGVPASLQRDAWPGDFVAASELDELEEGTPVSITTNGSDEDRLLSTPASTQQQLFERPAGAEQNGAEISPRVKATEQANDHDTSYTLENFKTFYARISEEQFTAAEWKAEYTRLRNSETVFVSFLTSTYNAQQLKGLAAQFGSFDANRSTKPENALSVYRACLKQFVLGNSIQFDPMQESMEEAVDRLVDGLTDDEFTAYYSKQQQQRDDHSKALSNPETLLEFHTFVRERSEAELSDQQHLRRDQLYADMSRQTRIQQQSNSVEQFESLAIEGLQFSIKQGYHDKRECDLWIVQLSTRVDRTTFGELKLKAQQLGGWYSSFKKSDAGFQFLTEEAANKFTGLKEGDVDRSDQLEERRIRKMSNTAERFTAMADRLTEKAESTLEADGDKLKNTERRAAQAASVRARARDDLATAATLRSVATRLQEEHASYLDGVRSASQIAALRLALQRGRWAHIRHVMQTDHADLSSYARNVKQDELEQRPLDSSDIRYVEYPKPYLNRGHLERAFAQLGNTKGVKQITAKMEKLVRRSPKDQSFVEFNREDEISLLEDFLARAKAAQYDCYWFDHCLEDYKRIRAANIYNAHELRVAVAELLPHINPAAQDDPVTSAMDELRGKKLPGFFPTPRPIILQMLEEADIQGDDRVLEPSAGMGDILDAIREQHPDVDLKAIEQNRTLSDVLAAKAFDEITTFGDFLEHRGPYDKILMNPPFENGADIDHVRHAYELLSVGGRVVSVMCEGPFFRSDAKSTSFREWLEECNAVIEPLPDDSFQGTEAFRQTGVKTRLVVIEK